MSKKFIFNLIFIAFLMNTTTTAQTATFDIATYTPPKGWKEEKKEGVITYSIVNDNKYCVIMLNQSIATSGNAQKDFAQNWRTFVIKLFSDAPQKPDIQTTKDDKGSEVLLAGATVQFLKAPCAAMLVDYSGFGRVFSILILMNDDAFEGDINKFMDGITLQKMDTPKVVASSASNNSFKDVSFTVPDGWKQQNYSDGIVLQSPNSICEKDVSYTISILNNQPFNL